MALDASGHGSAGSFHNVSRVENGGCGGALVFEGTDSYVSIPYRSTNHPDKEITVSTWFYTDSFEPQSLISTCHNGGYCLGFGDGNDLWWTVSIRSEGDVSVNIQHEGITKNQWHHVAGIYDGETVRIYLDGILRNSVNATGPIVYTTPNYVFLGAKAGYYDEPDPACPRWFTGGLDEVRIYDVAIPYARIMDDRFACSQDPAPPTEIPVPAGVADTCTAASGSIRLGPGETTTRLARIDDADMTGEWKVTMQPGSTLVVNAQDRYSTMHPDAWYIEIADRNGRIDRSIAFPNTRNTPVDGVVPDGNATVSIRYFDGKEQFPATVLVQFTAIAPPPPPEPPKTILSYPIIVIYSASWATLIALVLVILWLHKRHKERKQNSAAADEKKDS